VALHLVSYNIRLGGGRRVPLIAGVLADLEPDVVILQEATNRFAVEQLAELTGLRHVAASPGVSVAALARSPFVATTWHAPPGVRAFLEFQPASSDLRFIGLHLTSGLSRRGERARLRHLDAMEAIIGPRVDDGTVLVGDLNSVAPGDEPRVRRMPFWLQLLLRLDGPIRTDVINRLLGAGWVDVFRRLHPDRPGYTLPAAEPHVRLDYMLASPSLVPRIQRCEPADHPDGGRASDHLPLVSVIA
jgi:endonuclease/exonuclease/phosphatase family metal-dependent hydrolase